MDEKLTLQVDVFAKLDQLDAMLKKLDKLDKLMEAFDEQLKATNRVLDILGKNTAFTKLTAQLDKLKFALSGVRSVTGLIGTAFGKAFDLGKDFFEEVVNSAQFKQNTLVSFETFLGSKQAADEEFARVLKIAQKTPADTEELVNVTRTLLQAGFKRDEMDSLRAMAADIQALTGSNETMSQFTVAISKIKGQGKLDANDRTSLLNAGIGSDQLNKQLGILLKIKGTEKQVTEEILKRQGKHKIGANVAIKAAQMALKEILKEDKLGEYAIRMSAQLGGAVSNFRNGFKDVLKSLDLDKSPGIKAFSKFLNNVTEELGSDKFRKAIAGIIEELFGGFDKIDKNKISSFFTNSIIPGLETIRNIIAEIWTFIGNIINSNGLGDALGKFVDQLKDIFIQLGNYIGQGLKQGLLQRAPLTQEEVAKGEMVNAIDNPGMFLGSKLEKENPANNPFLGTKIEPKKDDNNKQGPPPIINVTVNAETNASPKEIAKETADSVAKTMSENARNEARMKGKYK